MKNKYKNSIGVIAVLIVMVAGVYALYSNRNIPKVSQDSQESRTDEETAVRNVVEAFGKQLQFVPLMGSREIIEQAINEHYAPLVTKNLLAYWRGVPTQIPGRLTSSPWPDHIEILSLTKDASGVYIVEGKVIEMTSQEVAHAGVASYYFVAIQVTKTENAWLISSYLQRKGTD